MAYLLMAVAAAVTCAWSASPWSAPGGTAVASALLLGPALVLGVLGWPLGRALERRVTSARRVAAWWAAREVALVIAVGVTHLFVGAPRGGPALIGYGVAAAAAAGSAAWLLRNRRLGERLRAFFASDVVGVSLVVLAVELVVADALLMPREHRIVHLALLGIALLVATTGLALLARNRPPRWLAIPSLAVLGASALAGALSPAPLWRAIVESHSAHARLVALARQLADGDGDGFSPYFGGGDCDDHDAGAHPLSPDGRDCLGWRDERRALDAAVTPRLPAGPRRTDAPTTIVLVTVDALRCGFGDRSLEGPPLYDACPELTALGARGRLDARGHASYPATIRAMTALHSGDLLARPSDRVDDRPMLARRLGRAGYETTAVVTHPYLLRDADVRASFDRVDTQLAERASQPRAATAEGVTDRILAALAGPERARFVWGHYFDAHAPYVRSDNEVVAGPAIAAYAAEVRRVDQAIGRLARALAARPDRDRIVLFVTADHAESFGEHGAATHGQDLHEEALRIPMLVWSPGRDPRAFGAEVLPESTVEIARYLVGMVVVAPPLPSRMMRLARAPLDDDDQLAVTTRDGWKLIVHRTLNYAELYHLPTDPTEETDLALVEPARVEVLGAALAELHAQVEAERQPARSASSRR